MLVLDAFQVSPIATTQAISQRLLYPAAGPASRGQRQEGNGGRGGFTPTPGA